MTLNEFAKLLTAARPGSRAYRNTEYGGTRQKSGLSVVFEPGGKVYEYTGPFIGIAIRLKLVSVWSIVCDQTDEQRGSEITEAAAQKRANRENQFSAELTARWGYPPRTYSVRRIQ